MGEKYDRKTENTKRNVYLFFFFVRPGAIIKDMSSKNEAKASMGALRAEELLGNDAKPWDESSLKTVHNGTKINLKAFENLGEPEEEIPPDAGTVPHVVMRGIPSERVLRFFFLYYRIKNMKYYLFFFFYIIS